MHNKKISYARKGLAILALVLWLVCPGWAHPLSQKLEDPPALALGMKLGETLSAANNNFQDPAFIALLIEDPNLSKRAYVALLNHMIELAEQESPDTEKVAILTAVIAQVIEQQFGDPKPLEIFKAIAENQEGVLDTLLAYAESLPRQTAAAAPGEYGPDSTQVSDIPAEIWQAIRPLFVKLTRLQVALAAVNPQLLISELDTYPEVEKRAFDAAIAAGVPADSLPNSGDYQKALDLQKLVVLAEIGVLDEFEKRAEELAASETDMATVAGVYMTGYRAAYRQNRKELAQEYLSRAREAMSRPEAGSDPVLEYAVRTAEFQMRRLNGYKPGEADLVAEFEKAWSALDTYEPMKVIAQENNWYYGRMATRYWMDELRPYPLSTANQVVVIADKLSGWFDKFDPNLMGSLLAGEQPLLSCDQVFGLLNFLAATADQLAYIMESLPQSELKGMKDFVSQIQVLTDVFVMIQEKDFLGLAHEQGPGFPPYDIRTGGLVPELIARGAYLNGLSSDISAEQRAIFLTTTVDKIRDTQNPEITVDYLIKAGTQLNDLGHHDQAIAAWKEALAIADDLSFVLRGLDAATLLAEEYGRQGDWQNAALYAERAADKLQSTAPMLGLRSPEGQLMAQKTQEVTELSVKAAVEADDPERALAALTRGQQVSSAAAQMEGQKEAQAEVREVQAQEEQVVALASEVKRLEAMPASPTRDSLLQSTQGLLADSKAKFLAESRGLRQKYAELYNQILRFDPLNLPDIQKTLPADLAVVQYFPTDDALYIFLVTNDKFRLHKVQATRKGLEDSTKIYTRAIRRAVNDDPVVASESRKLYDAMVLPVEADIAACNTLVLIPSGRLNSLPFAALTDKNGDPLGKSKQLLELAKPTDLMRMTDTKPDRIDSIVAFANATGDLPAAGKEGEQIAALFGQDKAKLFKGKEATKDAFVKFGGQAEALHLATHGEWNVEDSLANFLAMANQEKVAQDEIFQLSLDGTSIVILSACNTAMGDGGDVKYVASLAEAFWIAGSRSVVASLWAVNDASTSLLMTEFYKSLRAGDSKAEALRKAQMAVRAKPEFSHPYFWSGFILFGDWR